MTTEDGNYDVVEHSNVNETGATVEKALDTGKVN
jgi:hypothetical protein